MGWDDEDDEETVPCPYCQEPIHEDSQRCPHCENYISQEDAPPSRKPTWIVVGLIICLIIALMWTLN
jgi:predicted nucleic acid-binding Zn ribbon protein